MGSPPQCPGELAPSTEAWVCLRSGTPRRPPGTQRVGGCRQAPGQHRPWAPAAPRELSQARQSLISLPPAQPCTSQRWRLASRDSHPRRSLLDPFVSVSSSSMCGARTQGSRVPLWGILSRTPTLCFHKASVTAGSGYIRTEFYFHGGQRGKLDHFPNETGKEKTHTPICSLTDTLTDQKNGAVRS